MSDWTVDRQIRRIERSVAARRLATMAFSERLERWADQLDTHVDPLHLLSGIELLSNSRRAALRMDASPLSIAFADTALRDVGLSGDTYGDASRFFGLSHGTFHEIVCDCHYRGGSSAPPGEVSQRVRRAARRARRVEQVVSALGLSGTQFGSVVARLLT